MPLPQVLLEQDEAGNTLASYTYGLELISMTKGGNTYYYIYDGLGNVIAVTNEAGQTIQTYDYDAFGNVINTTGELTNPYQFIGAYGCANDGVGLIYMRARYYAPETGRFITRDPLRGSPYKPLSLNRYIYVENNPINWVDPSGIQRRSERECQSICAPDLKGCNTYCVSHYAGNVTKTGKCLNICRDAFNRCVELCTEGAGPGQRRCAELPWQTTVPNWFINILSFFAGM